ncbi:HAD family phosphatase [Alteromonas sp.]|uniref:HAD family hydrolase n=1 Tax=Gammaproteobacteria TaxID=1236 RepID=UPI000C602963|nr:HAD family phosphatase [Alteromonas sp.]MAI37153.1 HAD family hydrolase [Alteromonas sp.]|tara:strand:- start:5965 stop:6627 length:663 start_codon:yes stop_codon:yes gene_type:complete
MTPFKLIIFDCDGVLVDSEGITTQVFIDMLAELGINITLEEIMNRYVGMPMSDGLAMLAKQYGFTPPTDFVERFYRNSMVVLADQLQPVPGIKMVIKQLQLPFCVASNSRVEKVRAMLNITGLLGSFEGKIFTACQVENPKPAPDVYLYAAKVFNADPSDCLVIEDTPVGVSAAKAAGMTVYGYSAITPALHLWDAGAHSVFNEMSGLLPLVQRCGSCAN